MVSLNGEGVYEEGGGKVIDNRCHVGPDSVSVKIMGFAVRLA